MSNHTPTHAPARTVLHKQRRKQLVAVEQRPLILLAEDDPDMRRMLASSLRQDYEVVEVSDGDEALTWLGPGVLDGDSERLPALIVSDIRLPYFSGLEILEGMQLASRRVPVILITGFGDTETHAAARQLGAQQVLDKPFEIRELLDAVARALRLGPTDAGGRGAEGANEA